MKSDKPCNLKKHLCYAGKATASMVKPKTYHETGMHAPFSHGLLHLEALSGLQLWSSFMKSGKMSEAGSAGLNSSPVIVSSVPSRAVAAAEISLISAVI